MTLSNCPHRAIVILCFAAIIVFYYLGGRGAFPQMTQVLKPGRMGVMETYALDHLKNPPDFPCQRPLKPKELLYQFSALTACYGIKNRMMVRRTMPTFLRKNLMLPPHFNPL